MQRRSGLPTVSSLMYITLFVFSWLLRSCTAQDIVTALYGAVLTADTGNYTYPFMVVNMVPTDTTSCTDWTVDDPDFTTKMSSATDSFGQFIMNKKYIFVLAHGWQQQFEGPNSVITNFYPAILRSMNSVVENQSTISSDLAPTMDESAFICITWPSSNVNITLNNEYNETDSAQDSGASPWNYYDMITRAEDIGNTGGAMLLDVIYTAINTLYTTNTATDISVGADTSTVRANPVVTLLGHSFGTILLTQAVSSYATLMGGSVDSLVLLQAAMPALSFITTPDVTAGVHLEGAYTQVPLSVKRALVSTYSSDDYELHIEYPLSTEITTLVLGGLSYMLVPRACGPPASPLPLEDTPLGHLTQLLGPEGANQFYQIFQGGRRRRQQASMYTHESSTYTISSDTHIHIHTDEHAHRRAQLLTYGDIATHAQSLSLSYQAMGAVGVSQTDVMVGTGAQVFNEISPAIGIEYLYNFNVAPVGGWPYIYSINATTLIHDHGDIFVPETMSIVWQAALAAPWEA